MDVFNKEEDAGVEFYDARVSEGELGLYQGCIEYLLKTAGPEAVLLSTGCTEDQLRAYCDQFRQLLLENAHPEFLMDRLRREVEIEQSRAGVEVLKIEETGSVCLFDLRFSEAELKLIERCIDYVLNTCGEEEQITWWTDCESSEELEVLYEYVLRAIRNHVDPDYLPDRPLKQFDEEDDY